MRQHRLLTGHLIVVVMAWWGSFAMVRSEELVIPDAQVSLRRQVMVPAKVSGTLENVLIEQGRVVKQGELLAQLEDGVARAELTAAREDVAAAQLQSDNDVAIRLGEKTLAVSRQDLLRNQLANQKFPNSISMAEIDRLQLVVDQSSLSTEQARHEHLVAEAQLRQKQAALSIAEQKLALHRVVAPMDGMVVDLQVEPGEWLEVGSPLLRIVQLDQLRVEAFADGLRLTEGTLLGHTATFESTWNQEMQVHEGKVVFVSPELNPVTGQMKIWVDLPNVDVRLRPGVRGTLRLAIPSTVEEGPNPVETDKVPSTAETSP